MQETKRPITANVNKNKKQTKVTKQPLQPKVAQKEEEKKPKLSQSEIKEKMKAVQQEK